MWRQGIHIKEESNNYAGGPSPECTPKGVQREEETLRDPTGLEALKQRVGQVEKWRDAEQLSGGHQDMFQLISALWQEYVSNLAQSEPKSY